MTRDELCRHIGSAGQPWPGSTKEDQGDAVLDTIEDCGFTLIDTSPEGIRRMAGKAWSMLYPTLFKGNVGTQMETVTRIMRIAIEAGKVKDG